MPPPRLVPPVVAPSRAPKRVRAEENDQDEEAGARDTRNLVALASVCDPFQADATECLPPVDDVAAGPDRNSGACDCPCTCGEEDKEDCGCPCVYADSVPDQLPRYTVLLDVDGDTSQDRRFLCPLPGCGSTFASYVALNTHWVLHVSERVLACPYLGCPNTYSDRGDMGVHIDAAHVQRVPFKCSAPACGATFPGLVALQNHVTTTH
jgi:hypothetical protein